MRRKKAEAAARLDVLKASDQEVQKALDALDASVTDTTDLATQAAEAERRAALEAESADRQLAVGEERLRAALVGLRGQAIHAYTSPAPGTIELSNVSTAGDISRSLVYADIRIGRSADKLDEVRGARADLAVARRRAAKSAKDAADRRAASDAQLTNLQNLQATQTSVASSLEAKVTSGANEVDSLAASDAQLSDAIARQDAEAAARRRAELLAQQAAETARLTRLLPPLPPALAQAVPRQAGGGQGGGAPAQLQLPILLARPQPGPPRAVPTAPAGPGLSTVRGITVSSSIAGQLASLLSASDSAGLQLGGGGYRSSDQQIQTRRANCGSSNYNIYEEPASSCSPPTAKPGSSMHERGLAIDFTNRGSLISSHSNPAWQWMAANAGRFGFSNLPSEPWHWSTNGG